MKVANIQSKDAKVAMDAIVAQKRITEAKNMELEVSTFVEISKLKADLSITNKEVKKLREEKKKLGKKLVRAKEKAIKEYKSSKQFANDLLMSH